MAAEAVPALVEQVTGPLQIPYVRIVSKSGCYSLQDAAQWVKVSPKKRGILWEFESKRKLASSTSFRLKWTQEDKPSVPRPTRDPSSVLEPTRAPLESTLCVFGGQGSGNLSCWEGQEKQRRPRVDLKFSLIKHQRGRGGLLDCFMDPPD